MSQINHLRSTSAVLSALDPPVLPWPEEPVVETLHRRFEQVAEIVPDSVAMTAGEAQITYAELDGKANAIAAALIDRLGGGSHRIAILSASDIDHVAAVLGVWKAGSTAVPLHDANPDGRLQHILEHAECRGIVSDTLATDRAVRLTTRVDGLASIQIPEGTAAKPDVEVSTDTLARIMYTSGSTGTPKGVMLSHRYQYNKERNAFEQFRFGKSDRLAQLFPLAMAAATTNTLGALLNGGTTLRYNLGERGIHHLADWLEEEGATSIHVVPTLFRRFLQTVEEDRTFESVRFVSVGAEVALRADVELFSRHFPSDARFVHRLAATEVGEIASYVLSDPESLSEAVVPAGYPARGKDLLLLDEAGKPVAEGEIGELVVRGTQLSDGYWRNDELNALHFVEDPDFSGARRFHTRDMARIRPDGTLQHLGRQDSRIKVRGFGVDLIEVEHALLAGPGIAEGVVVASADSEGQPTLVAYYVTQSAVDQTELRSHLGDYLPDYMIPTAIVALDELPLTPRGKVDRASLAERPIEIEERPYTAPETDTQQQLAALWSEILERDRVGIDDDFFAVGGDSIKAYQLIAAIFNTMGADLPASTMLSAATVREQAALLESGEALSARSSVPYRTEGPLAPWFCVHGMGGGILFMQKLYPHLDEDRPIYALQPEVMANEEAFYMTVEEIATGYVAEIRTLQPTGPYFLGSSCFGGLVAQEMARQLEEQGETVASLIMIDPPSPNWDRPKRTRIQRWKGRANRIKNLIVRRKDERATAERWERTAALRVHHTKAARAHKPRPSNVPIEVLGAIGSTRRHDWMWSPVAAGGLNIEEFPSSHEAMYDKRNVGNIGEMINSRWRQAEAVIRDER